MHTPCVCVQLCLRPASLTALRPCQVPPPPALTAQQQLMALLSSPTTARSLLWPALGSNALVPEALRQVLGTPSMQAVLQGAASSADPAQYFLAAMADAGIDVAALLGANGDAAWDAAHPPPPPPLRQRSSAAGRAAGAPLLLLCAAAAAMLLSV